MRNPSSLELEHPKSLREVRRRLSVLAYLLRTPVGRASLSPVEGTASYRSMRAALVRYQIRRSLLRIPRDRYRARQFLSLVRLFVESAQELLQRSRFDADGELAARGQADASCETQLARDCAWLFILSDQVEKRILGTPGTDLPICRILALLDGQVSRYSEALGPLQAN